MSPKYISDLFVTSCNDKHELRSNHRKLYLQKPKTNLLKKSFSYRGAVSWNSLPTEIANECGKLSTKGFKTVINKYYQNLETLANTS